MGRTKGSNTSPSATREWCQRRVRVKGHRTRLNEVDEIVQGWGGSEKEGTRANTCARAMYHHCTANLLERYYYRSTLSYKCHCIVQEFPFPAPAASPLFFLRSLQFARGWKVDAAGIGKRETQRTAPVDAQFVQSLRSLPPSRSSIRDIDPRTSPSRDTPPASASPKRDATAADITLTL